MALLESVDTVLGDGAATLVLVDEFALRREPTSSVHLPLLQHTRDLLYRMGWTGLHEEIFDVEASRFVVAAEHAVDRLGLSGAGGSESAPQPTSPQALLLSQSQVLSSTRERIASGESGFRRLRVERLRRPLLRIVRVDASKAEAMRTLFEQVFGHPMSEAHWQWKYGGGRGRAVGAIKDGQLVAHYGGVSRPVLFHGERTLACQVGDVMVLASANRSLARTGPMKQIGATFAVLEVGYGLPHLVGFGFPNARAFGVAKRLGLYEAVDELVQVSWPAAGAGARMGWVIESLSGSSLEPQHRRVVDALWARMAPAFGKSIVGVRDADWIEHRYLQRPSVNYTVLLVRSRWWRRPIGLLVLRQQDQVLNLLDMVCAPEFFGELVRVARLKAQSIGALRVACWITRSQQHRLHRADADHQQVEPLGIQIPTTIQTEGPSHAALKDHWFLMQGDADFT